MWVHHCFFLKWLWNSGLPRSTQWWLLPTVVGCFKERRTRNPRKVKDPFHILWQPYIWSLIWACSEAIMIECRQQRSCKTIITRWSFTSFFHVFETSKSWSLNKDWKGCWAFSYLYVTSPAPQDALSGVISADRISDRIYETGLISSRREAQMSTHP